MQKYFSLWNKNGRSSTIEVVNKILAVLNSFHSPPSAFPPFVYNTLLTAHRFFYLVFRLGHIHLPVGLMVKSSCLHVHPNSFSYFSVRPCASGALNPFHRCIPFLLWHSKRSRSPLAGWMGAVTQRRREIDWWGGEGKKRVRDAGWDGVWDRWQLACVRWSSRCDERR